MEMALVWVWECPSCGRREDDASRTTRGDGERLCVNPACNRKPPMRLVEAEQGWTVTHARSHKLP